MKKKVFCLISLLLVLALGSTNVTFGGHVWEGEIVDETDDVEQMADFMYMNSNDLEFFREGGPLIVIGLRYVNVIVPQGAHIVDAYVEFVNKEITEDLPVHAVIEGELSPNASPFIPDPNNVTNRSGTEAQVLWTLDEWAVVDQKHQTPNIAPVIEEIVNHRYWVSGNALALIIYDDPDNPSQGLRVARASTPLLHIDYIIDWPFATQPNPADGTTGIARDDTVLSWTPGAFAHKHDVYFGTSFNDVSDATTGSSVFMGRQAPNTYALDRLELGQTYYWRVDEVNAPPDSTISKGEVWQFTAEPYVYPLDGTNITATASSSNSEGEGPENTINGSGLDENALHSAESANMWVSARGGPAPTWIQYEFDRAYKLNEMRVWNHNTTFESYVGFGIKDVTIEYSANGTDWTELDGVPEFARAPAAPGYAHNTTVDFAGVAAKYVKITANDNWGLLNQYGLSEIRFFYLPVCAREPSPDSGATDVDPEVTLSFRAGREAVKHYVYLGTDKQAVIDGTADVTTVTETTYDPLFLDLGQTYYWRIDEVNEAEAVATWQSDIWDFTTRDYLIVDDFEDYNIGNAVWWSWKDGFGYGEEGGKPAYDGNGTGSVVGDETSLPTFMEMSFVHSGYQSMPYWYDNNKQGFAQYSEAALTLPATERDWTAEGCNKLSLWFRGESANIADPLYVAIANVGGTPAVVYHDDPSAVQLTSWTQWIIPLQSLADQGLDLTNVDSIAIGVGTHDNVTNPGGSGKIYIDDITLYLP